ncbi:uncharacterized protein PHALS_03605 [Plasmopara halstedii]|uniref:RxLR-like protein n=1 Tax=Plasmopara halstedii TaxID=4781 RepID=A0A0P1B0Y1_PLAHL|nr:uncharacterized protein PHALS_03605 [Plasmopara halstedii]CEG46936.1 hypothetical protein PHALS_03605 [Plasmopara halstedii]|eukprot:XP_024583305.1 hypothetical protein PHALS_03605 [Plasmopara halstedii]
MFRKFTVWTAVIVAVHSNNVLALQQSNSITQNDAYTTMSDLNSSSSTDNSIPSANEPTSLTSGLHAKDCNPNFPTESIESTITPSPVPTSTPEASPATNPTPLNAVTPTLPPEKTSTSTPSENTSLSANPISTTDDLGENGSDQTAQQANTQSSETNNVGSTSTVGLGLLATVAAVAAVGTAASRMKKAREDDADAALATPGDSHIHIEIKHTPTGGSTIL